MQMDELDNNATSKRESCLDSTDQDQQPSAKKAKGKHRMRTEAERVARVAEHEANRLKKREKQQESHKKKMNQSEGVREMFEMKRKLGALVKEGKSDEGRAIYDEFKAAHPEVQIEQGTLNLLLSSVCGTHGVIDLPAAQAIWDQLSGKKENAYSLMIKAYCENQAFDKAIEMLEEMKELHLIPRLRTYSPFWKALSEAPEESAAAAGGGGGGEGGGGGGAAAAAASLAARGFALWAAAKAAGLRPGEPEYRDLLGLATRAQAPARFAEIMEDFMEDVLCPQDAETWACLKKWFESPAAGAGWEVREGAAVDAADGRCAGCRHRLRSVALSAGDRARVLAQSAELAVRGQHRSGDGHFEAFTRDLARRVDEAGEKIDAVIDGANVGYFCSTTNAHNTTANLIHIDEVMRALAEQEGRPNALVVLHQRHLAELEPDCQAVADRWRAEGRLVEVPKGGPNDDWYWLWATLKCGGDTLMITNDLMRDHHFAMLSHRSFLRWRERHKTSFKFGHGEPYKRSVTLMKPPVYSQRMQKGDQDNEGSSCWHIPDAEVLNWLCIHKKEGCCSS